MSTNTIISWKPEQVVRQLPWHFDSKAALGLLLILATFSLVGWLYLTQASAVTTTRYRIDELRLELDHLQNQNAALALEIAQLENLGRIETRARELGLGPTTNVRYLVVSSYPMRQTTNEDIVENRAVIASRPVETIDMPSPVAEWWNKTLDELTAWLVEE